jgi:Tfp pilus assembly protein PilN
MGLKGKFGSSYTSSFLLQGSNVTISVCRNVYGSSEIIYFNTIPYSEILSNSDVKSIFRLKRTQHILLLPPSQYNISLINLPPDGQFTLKNDIIEIVAKNNNIDLSDKQIDYEPVANDCGKAYAIYANTNHILTVLNHFGPYKEYFDAVTTFDNACAGLYEELNIGATETLLILSGPLCSRALWMSCNGISKIAPLPNINENSESKDQVIDEIVNLTMRNHQRFLEKTENKQHRIIVTAANQQNEDALIKKFNQQSNTNAKSAKFNFKLESIPQHPHPSDLATIGVSLLRSNEASIIKTIDLLPKHLKHASITGFLDLFTIFRLFIAVIITSCYVGIQAYSLNSSLFTAKAQNSQAHSRLQNQTVESEKQKETANAIAVGTNQLIQTRRGFSNYFSTMSNSIIDGVWITNFTFKNNPYDVHVEGYALETRLAKKFHNTLKRSPLFSNTQFQTEGSSSAKSSVKASPNRKIKKQAPQEKNKAYTHFLIKSSKGYKHAK